MLFAPGTLGIAVLMLSFDWAPFAGRLEVSEAVMIAFLGAQLAVLLAVAVLVGLACAPPVGLRSHAVDWVEGRGVSRPAIKMELIAALTLGALVSLLVVGMEYLAPLLLDGQRATTVSMLLGDLLPRIVFGGITEELLLRWGVMSFVVFVLWKLTRPVSGQASPSIYWSAIVVSAGLFAVAHLPGVAGMYGLTVTTVAYVLAGNMLGGVAFGWLFWRYSIEAAIVAHGFAHLLAIAINVGLIAVGLEPG